MRSLAHEATRRELHTRIDTLRPDLPARWGSMNCAEMVAHLVEGMRLGAGEYPTRTRKLLIRHFPLKQLFVYLLPLPKGIKAPARELMTQGRTIDWDATLADLHSRIDSFPAIVARGITAEHPYLGPLSDRAWGHFGWKHIHHHLRQFGA